MGHSEFSRRRGSYPWVGGPQSFDIPLFSCGLTGVAAPDDPRMQGLGVGEEEEEGAFLPELDERGLTASQRVKQLQDARGAAEKEKKRAYTEYRCSCCPQNSFVLAGPYYTDRKWYPPGALGSVLVTAIPAV